jgi:hypothetical protein
MRHSLYGNRFWRNAMKPSDPTAECVARRRGAAIVEMAVVTPILLLILFGIIEFGWVFMTQETLTHAAREACRTGALPGATDAEIQTRFAEAMAPTGLDIDDDMLTIEHIQDEVDEDKEIVRVSVSVPYSQVSLLGGLLGLDITNLGASCSMRKEG